MKKNLSFFISSLIAISIIIGGLVFSYYRTTSVPSLINEDLSENLNEDLSDYHARYGYLEVGGLTEEQREIADRGSYTLDEEDSSRILDELARTNLRQTSSHSNEELGYSLSMANRTITIWPDHIRYNNRLYSFTDSNNLYQLIENAIERQILEE